MSDLLYAVHNLFLIWRERMGKAELSDRDAKLAEMYKEGCTMQEIGEGVGMSRQNVHLRVKALGLTWKDGGAHVRSGRRKASKKQS